MDKTKLIEFLKKNISESDAVEDNVCDFFFSDKEKYILGTGRQAAVVMEICRNFKTEINGLIREEVPTEGAVDFIKNRKGYWKECLNNLQVKNIDQLEGDKDIQIILTVGNKKYEEYEKKLAELGFDPKCIFRCNWEHNTDLRKICYKAYQLEYESWRGI